MLIALKKQSLSPAITYNPLVFIQFICIDTRSTARTWKDYWWFATLGKVMDNCMLRVAPNGISYATRLATVISIGLTYKIMLKGLNR